MSSGYGRLAAIRDYWMPRDLKARIEVRVTDIDEVLRDLERERVRLAACGVVAMSNTPETAAKARTMDVEYWSASCADVASAVDREMSLRAENERLREALERLARLGNGRLYGNSEGNMIARAALENTNV